MSCSCEFSLNMGVWIIITLQGVFMLSVMVLCKPTDEIAKKPRSEPVCQNNVTEEANIKLHGVCAFSSSCQRTNELAECVEITPGECVCELPGVVEERKKKKSKKNKKKKGKKKGKKKKTSKKTKKTNNKSKSNKSKSNKSKSNNSKSSKSKSTKSRTKEKKPSKCADGWEQFGRNCYMHSRDDGTWDVVEANCNKYHEGAHLASVHSMEEHNFIYEHVRLMKSMMFLGGKYDEETDKWSWIDGTPFSFENWTDELEEIAKTHGVKMDIFYTHLYPNDCVCMKQEWNFDWDGYPCVFVLYGICKYSLD